MDKSLLSFTFLVLNIYLLVKTIYYTVYIVLQENTISVLMFYLSFLVIICEIY